MEINCGNFLLRPLSMSDKDSLAKYANNYNIWKNVRDRLPHPYSVADAIDFISHQQQEPLTGFCIEYNNECIGMIGFILQTDVYRKSAEFGYWLGEPFWGQGIITAAAIKVTQYAFDQFDLVRLYAAVYEGNKASVRVLEKAGFRYECTFEKAVFKNNCLMDEHRYCILSPYLLL